MKKVSRRKLLAQLGYSDPMQQRRTTKAQRRKAQQKAECKKAARREGLEKRILTCTMKVSMRESEAKEYLRTHPYAKHIYPCPLCGAWHLSKRGKKP